MNDQIGKDKSRQVELFISDLLRIGVVVSLAVVVIGTVITFVHHPDDFSCSDQLRRLTNYGAPFPHTVEDSLTTAAHGEGRGIAVLGLLLLVATPVTRVAVSILGFVYERDWVFVAITTTVLVLLLLSFVLGKGAG